VAVVEVGAGAGVVAGWEQLTKIKETVRQIASREMINFFISVASFEILIV
jgi:hypothetical protein